MAEGYPTLKKKAFERVHLLESTENPNAKRDILSVSLNPEQRAIINKFKDLFQCDNDSTVLKELAEVGASVLLGFFSDRTLSWLASPRRTRSVSNIPKVEQNVTQNEEVK